jgi:hypothetical protein
MAKQAYVYSGTDWVPLASEVTNLTGYQTKALNQFAHRNLVINGDMQIAQRGTSTASITASGLWTTDRWKTSLVTLGTWTMSQENDAPTGSGFRQSTKLLCTTADASPAAGDIFSLRQIIEGQNLQHIKKGTSAAEQLTISFWVKSNVTGTYIVSLYDADNTRLTGKSYTISTSATWEKKTLTFAADTTGAFDNDNAGSLFLDFGLAAGSNYTSGTLQSSWTTYADANFFVGQTNLASATSNYWQITGVQLEVGDTATPFEFKSVEDDLLECMRYLQVWKDDNKAIYSGHYWSSTESMGTLNFKIPMRGTPTVTASSGTALKSFTGVGQVQRVSSSISSDAVSDTALDLIAITSAATAGYATFNRVNGAGAYIWIVAEL